MITNDEINTLVNRYTTYLILPVVVTLCIWLLVLNVSMTALLVLCLIAGLSLGISIHFLLRSDLKKAMIVSNDPQKVIQERTVKLALMSIVLVCISGAVLLLTQ